MALPFSIVGLCLPHIETMLALTCGLIFGTNVFQSLAMSNLMKQLRFISTRFRPEP